MSGVQILYSVSEVMLSKSFNLNCSTRVPCRNQFIYRDKCIDRRQKKRQTVKWVIIIDDGKFTNRQTKKEVDCNIKV